MFGSRTGMEEGPGFTRPVPQISSLFPFHKPKGRGWCTLRILQPKKLGQRGLSIIDTTDLLFSAQGRGRGTNSGTDQFGHPSVLARLSSLCTSLDCAQDNLRSFLRRKIHETRQTQPMDSNCCLSLYIQAV